MFKLFNRKRQAGGSETGVQVALLILVACLAAWITHIIVCLKTASWGFLVAGALFFPIAIIHGAGIWFGVF